MKTSFCLAIGGERFVEFIATQIFSLNCNVFRNSPFSLQASFRPSCWRVRFKIFELLRISSWVFASRIADVKSSCAWLVLRGASDDLWKANLRPQIRSGRAIVSTQDKFCSGGVLAWSKQREFDIASMRSGCLFERELLLWSRGEISECRFEGLGVWIINAGSEFMKEIGSTSRSLGPSSLEWLTCQGVVVDAITHLANWWEELVCTDCCCFRLEPRQHVMALQCCRWSGLPSRSISDWNAVAGADSLRDRNRPFGALEEKKNMALLRGGLGRSALLKSQNKCIHSASRAGQTVLSKRSIKYRQRNPTLTENL